MFFFSLTNLEKVLACFILLVLVGCKAPVKSSNTVAISTSNNCPDKPTGLLNSDRVKLIDLDSQTLKESAIVSPGKDQGYAFTAKAGQTINYRTAQNICTWIFTPNNEVINSTNLPVDGRYTMQVATLTGSTTFELEMSLGDPERVTQQDTSQPISTESSNSSITQTEQNFSTSDFPKASCGDPLPTDANAYPVSFYPVFVPYSEANLDKARSLYCQDALKVRRKDTQEIAIQVSSFTNDEKSKSFANFITSAISDVEVGQPTVRTLN